MLGKTWLNKVRAPGLVEENKKKDEVLDFPPSPVLLNKHPSVSADCCWFGWDYWDMLTFQAVALAASRRRLWICSSEHTQGSFTRQNCICIFDQGRGVLSAVRRTWKLHRELA